MYKKFGLLIFVAALLFSTNTASASFNLVGSYTSTSSPIPTSGDYPKNAYRYGNILYIHDADGLLVVNTQGTITLSDDISLGRYNASSTPVVGTDSHDSFRSGNLLYIPVGSNSFGSGLYVIDTQGTDVLADDTLSAFYDQSSSPSIASSSVNGGYVFGNVLYISTPLGLSVVNTQGTSTQTDDVTVAEYSDTSTPSIGYSGNQGATLSFRQGSLLYVGGYGNGFGPELSVIDTQGTDTQTDDVVIGRYNPGSTPILDGGTNGGGITSAFLQGNLLYVGTYGGGLTVIDTQGTQTLSDDTLSAVYNTTSSPLLSDDYVTQVFASGNDVYVSTLGVVGNGGLNIISTQGTVTTSDDIVQVVNDVSIPAIPNGFSVLRASVFDDIVYLTVNTIELGPGGVYVLQSVNTSSSTITTTLPINATISITSPADVTMGAITGTGQSALTTNQAEWITKTNNAAGYELSIQASAVDMTNANLDTVAGYTPATPSTPEPWSIAATDSEWGMHYSWPQSTLGNDTVWGTGDSYADNWVDVPTTPYVIETATAPTDNIGDSAVIIFGAEVGSSKIQPTGTYSVDVTMTATTL